jgi:phosphatidylserine/phosphatidylglycerophosphate/cardiolipin synthase-like enzyme/regulation of enolase protein 1 (concanavalin A-like superfamily)
MTTRLSRCLITLFVTTLPLALPRGAEAQTLASQERMCDPTFEDCRADILTYIQQETQQIDVAFWMMSDARYSNSLVAAQARGVTIRVLMDPRCTGSHPACASPMNQLASAGVPMRNRATSGILHWKMILFASQNQVEFSGANYVPFETTPEIPWVNYTDEIIYYSNDPAVVRSMMRKFDDLWTSTTEFVNYANITAPLTRSYPTYAIDPAMNYPPDDSYRARALQAYDAEPQAIDVFMFRITDLNHTRAMLRALDRGVPVRLITDEEEYRNRDRLWDAYNVDIMYHAGVQVKLDSHQGIDHAKGVILYGSGLSIFGSSNWTSPSSDSQREHNYFTTKPAIFTWMAALFDRKWNNSSGHTETKTFVPLPPDVPAPFAPANGATGVATSGVVLQWNAGLWGHIYDIYFGTTPDPPLVLANRELGPSQYATDYRSYTIGGPLQPGTTYYWRVVSKTMAFVTAAGPTWSFTTAGTPVGANTPPAVSITSPSNGATFTAPASITLGASASDGDGTIAKVDFYSGTTLLGTDATAPYSFTWTNVPAGSYTVTAVASDDDGATTTSAAVSISVSGGASTLPAQWSNTDVGSTGAAGSASYAGATFTVAGAGADVWGTADAFQYVYRPLTGDGAIIARVTAIQNVNAWTKAGVMIRNSLSPSAAQGFMLVAASATKGVPFQRRLADGATSVSTSGSQSTAPRWVKLVRAGSVLTGYESADGVTWTTVASDTFSMGATVLVGLAVSSHVTGVTATATFDNVSVTGAAPPPNTPPTVTLTSPSNGAAFTAPATISLAASAGDTDGTIASVAFYAGSTLLGTATTAPYSVTWNSVPAGSYTLTAVATDDRGAVTTSSAVTITVSTAPAAALPAGWAQADIGAVPQAGSGTQTNGTFSVTGSGADIWGSADAFHYVYRTMTGDGTIVARVASIPQGINAWVKAGVMIRASLAADSPHALMLASAARGMAFQRRALAGDVSTSTSGSLSAAPRWVKLQRNGNLFSAYESADGVKWTLVGTESITMGATVNVGLAVTSHTTAASATCAFDGVVIQ